MNAFKIFIFPIALFLLTCATARVLHGQMDITVKLPHTPKPDSMEYQAICEGSRLFVLKEFVGGKKLPSPIVFDVQRMEVLGDYAGFEAIPRFKDGTPMGTEYIMDIVFDFYLHKEEGRWRVIMDLSSTDVPPQGWLRESCQQLPKDFPLAVINKFWREQFHKLRAFPFLQASEYAVSDSAYVSPNEISYGSPLRKMLFDQLRPKIQEKAKSDVRFRGHLRTFKGWACFSGESIDLKENSLPLPPMDNSDTVGVWLRTCQGWQLIAWSGGHSDMGYVVWTDLYGVPKELWSTEEKPPVVTDDKEWKRVFNPPYRQPTEVPPDNPLREQLLNVMRPAMERLVKQPVRFQGSLTAYKNWALYQGGLVDEKGAFINEKEYTFTYDKMAIVLLRGKDGWVLVDYSSSFDSDPYVIESWPRKYGECVWKLKIPWSSVWEKPPRW